MKKKGKFSKEDLAKLGIGDDADTVPGSVKPMSQTADQFASNIFEQDSNINSSNQIIIQNDGRRSVDNANGNYAQMLSPKNNDTIEEVAEVEDTTFQT